MNIERQTSNAQHRILYSDIRFIGVGNEYRQDDGVGIAIARQLGMLRLPGAHMVATQRDATRLMDLWQGADIVFVFDAVYSNGATDGIYRWDAINEQLSDDPFQLSTHTLGIAEAVELARLLNQLPPELILYGIGGRNFGQGQGLSLPCKRSALTVIRRVLAEIGV